MDEKLEKLYIQFLLYDQKINPDDYYMECYRTRIAYCYISDHIIEIYFSVSLYDNFLMYEILVDGKICLQENGGLMIFTDFEKAAGYYNKITEKIFNEECNKIKHLN